MGKYVEKATKLVAVINQQQEGSVVTMDDCYRGVFPWQSAYDSTIITYFSNMKPNILKIILYSILSRELQLG